MWKEGWRAKDFKVQKDHTVESWGSRSIVSLLVSLALLVVFLLLLFENHSVEVPALSPSHRAKEHTLSKITEICGLESFFIFKKNTHQDFRLSGKTQSIAFFKNHRFIPHTIFK